MREQICRGRPYFRSASRGIWSQGARFLNRAEGRRRGNEVRSKRSKGGEARQQFPSEVALSDGSMASSSCSKPTVEERISALEESMQKLRGMLNHLDEFLQNLDSEAGRRMERLELDILHTKTGMCEELDDLKKELQDPQKEIEGRVKILEQKMEQLNNEWKLERTQGEKKG
jgi:predicted RNase H-like nuclease (RuvC/YqgF family)